MTFATCLDVHCALGLDDSIHKSPLPIACTSPTLAFATVLLLLSDLSVTESSTDSTLIWLFSALVLLAAMLWRDALATVKGRLTLYHLVPCFAYIVYALHLPPHMYGVESSPLPTPMAGDLEGKSSRDSTLPLWLVWVLTWLTLRLWNFALARVKGILLSLYSSLRWSASPQDSDESTGAPCTFVRSIFGTSGSGRDPRNPPLPSLLWQFALAFFHDIFVNLMCLICKNSLASMSCLLATCREQIGMMVRCCQCTSHISVDDIDSSLDGEQSIKVTCTSPGLISLT